MTPPRSIKEVQHFTGKVATLITLYLGRWRDLTILQNTQVAKGLSVDCRGQKALEELKTYLRSTPFLSQQKPNEELFLCLVVSSLVISAVLVREKEKIQKPDYYISKVLHDAKTWHTKLELFIFTLIIYVKKLRPYFQAHSIVLLPDKIMRTVLHWLDTLG